MERFMVFSSHEGRLRCASPDCELKRVHRPPRHHARAVVLCSRPRCYMLGLGPRRPLGRPRLHRVARLGHGARAAPLPSSRRHGRTTHGHTAVAAVPARRRPPQPSAREPARAPAYAPCEQRNKAVMVSHQTAAAACT
eukprot:scaffold103600_cov38-Tisochrysis_lutea.AAC.5